MDVLRRTDFANGKRRTAVIIGAGPAGLTAAVELLRRTDVLPIVLEATGEVGGLSRTVEHNGNRIDIGGHRFFSKSERVMQWWQRLLPIDGSEFHPANPACSAEQPLVRPQCLTERNEGYAPSSTRSCASTDMQGSSAAAVDEAAGAGTLQGKVSAPQAVLLLRRRQSRIYFLRRFFDYPLALTADTLRKLGTRRTFLIAASYLRARLQPIQPERNLEDFLINRFGRELYRTFFRSYTEKVWGTPCHTISAAWGAQRIRGLSLLEAVRDCMRRDTSSARAKDRPRETSLIDKFLYPELGPGQMWQHAAAEILERGGSIHHGATVDRLCVAGGRITGVQATLANGAHATWAADFVFSTMPVPALIRAFSEPAPATIQSVADGLIFRDFLTVGVLVHRLALTEVDGSRLRDNWIYIQEPGIRMTRLQIFNNWSAGMVADPETIWLGLEYVCSEHDDLWRMPDAKLQSFAVRELEAIGLLPPSPGDSSNGVSNVLDSCVVRAPKAYPAYFGTYDRFSEVRTYLARFENLFPIGRNGQHRYNNQDHSMLTAMVAVDQVAANSFDPEALWSVNTEQTHHEVR